MTLDTYKRGFLPSKDPATQFQLYPELNDLSELGRQLPDLLLQADFRQLAQTWSIPMWPDANITPSNLPELRLYYVRLAFIASAYINQVSQPPCKTLPANIAQPLIHACTLLKRPPMLSYDGYALYNWFRIDAAQPVALGNIDTLQNFVNLYDEHWFILVHVAIEVLSGDMINSILNLKDDSNASINHCLHVIESTLKRQLEILARIPEHMSSELYAAEFRPYIGYFNDVSFEGTQKLRVNFRGETGAQSSILPLITAFLKIPHEETELTRHLNGMCEYMPMAHRKLIERMEMYPAVKGKASTVLFNRLLETIALFREQHFKWAKAYIADKTTDHKGTGGTPYYKWLQQLISETRGFKVKAKPSMHSSLEFMVADICELDVEAIVRPAHRNLYKGRGVSQQIFEQAGPSLLQACYEIDRANPGEAQITSAYNLPCDAVIHTVPPRWSGGDYWACQSLKELSNCYENSIKLALQNNIKTLAFVSLGTGGNKFPHSVAAHQALEVLLKYESKFQRLIMCLSSKSSLAIWSQAYQQFKYKKAA